MLRDKIASGSGVRHSALLSILAFLIIAGCETRTTPANEPYVKHFLAAQEALASGDKTAAMEALTKSIEAQPTGWAYIGRAKLYLEQDNDQAAIADCEAGLALDSQNVDLQWLLGEAKKAKAERFKGKNANPPSASK